MTDFALPGLMPLGAPKYEVHPLVLPLSPHRATDTLWSGISSIGPVLVNGESPAYAAARAFIIFTARFHEDEIVLTLDSDEGGDGSVLIIDEDTWAFEVPEQALDLEAGMWDWEFSVTDINGETKLYYLGTLLIRP